MNTPDFLGRAWRAVFNPVARLNTDFPWDLKKSARTYGLALVVYFVVTLGSALALIAAVMLTSFISPDMPLRIMNEHYMPFLVISSIVSFLCGFGAEVWYLKRELGKDRLSLKKIVGLNLDSLAGSKWSALWRGVVTWLVILGVDKLVSFVPMPEMVDPAADFLRALSGWPLYALAVLVVVGPIFEELVFRGFLYNMTRSALQKNGTTGRVAADVVALTVSASAFALMHFNLSGFLAYFIAGAILAESYRRSGSLYVPIVAHVLNNGTAVLLLLLAS
jgi:membrane protease YdiL (CAAX protease family)